MYSLQEIKTWSLAERIFLLFLIDTSLYRNNEVKLIEILDGIKVHVVVQNTRTQNIFHFNYKFPNKSEYNIIEFISLVRAEFPDVEIKERSE